MLLIAFIMVGNLQPIPRVRKSGTDDGKGAGAGEKTMDQPISDTREIG